jgi:hypothetical protein
MRKSSPGRKPADAIVLFRILVKALYLTELIRRSNFRAHCDDHGPVQLA